MTSKVLLFYLVYVSQLLIVSVYLPRVTLRRARELIDTYPPAAYPKLYPEPLPTIERKLAVFRNFNVGLLLLGVGLLAAAWVSDYRIAARYGAYPTLVAHAVYSAAQLAPAMLLSLWGWTYFRRMRAAARGRLRTAPLKARRLFDFVSQPLLVAAAATYVGAIASVLYLDKPPGWIPSAVSPWAAAIISLTVSNALLAGVIAWTLYGRKQDPHQTHEQRAKQSRRISQSVLFVSILTSAMTAGGNALHVFELWQYGSILRSLFLQLIVILMARVWLVQLDRGDFDVYKADPSPANALPITK